MSNSSALDVNAPLRKALAGLPSFPHRRIDALAKRIALHIESLAPQGRLHCLDIGSGDMTLAAAVQDHTSRADFSCVDVNRVPADDSFDVALLCDVLHDVPEHAGRLLAEAARVAGHVIVKDSFESGPYSRTMLRAMDFVGNRGYGSGLKRYFTRETFVQLAAEQRLAITALDCDLHLDLYEHLPVVGAALRHWHFIAVLAPRGCKKGAAVSKV